jgi:hypothetical protein
MPASSYQTRFSPNIKVLLFLQKKENTNLHYLFFLLHLIWHLFSNATDLYLCHFVFSLNKPLQTKPFRHLVFP